MKRFAALIALLAPFVASAQMSMSTLQNLPGVAVRVRAITPDGKTFGLTKDALIKVVSDAVSTAGVTVVPQEEMIDAADVPVLEITAIVNKLTGSGYIYSLRLALREIVEPKRKIGDLVELGAITWERETQGFTSNQDRILASTATLADRFVTEWKGAN